MSEKLPKGWVQLELAQIIEPRGAKVSPVSFPDSKFLGMDHVESNTTKIIGFVLASEMKSNASRFYAGDVLYGRLRPYLNKVAMPNFDGLASAEFIVFPDTPILFNKFLKHRLNSRDFVSFASHLNGGDRPRVSFDQIGKFTIFLPPLNEQKRIVAKIEELFSELDKGVESLKTAREQLKIYRQAILKHAFEGKLTAEWRERNKDRLESGDQLLERIKKLIKNNKAFNKNETADLPPIPLEWQYTRMANIGDLGRGKSKHRPRNDKKLFGGQYPFIQTGEVKAANRVVRQYSQTYSDFGLEQSKLWPTGTLCITIAANIAETAFLGFDACFPDSVVGFTAQRDIILPEYVDFFIQSVRARIEAYAPATAQKNINLTTLENLVIPICSTEEQKEMVQLLEVIFSTIEINDIEIEKKLQKSEALRQSILKKAFSGQLVAQDPNDEPASVLLERIRAEKEKTKKVSKKARAA